MRKTYKKKKEKLTSEGTELREPVAELEAPATDCKQAEEVLGKTEENKLTILNSISELVAYQDTEHRIIWTNKAAAESVGLTPAQLVGQYCYEIWPQRDTPCAGCPVAKARQTGKPQQAEITTPDGRVWLIKGYPTRDENGAIIGLLEVALDITEGKQAEEALKESRDYLERLTDSMWDAVFLVKMPERVIEWANDSFRLIGYEPDECVGQTTEFLYPDMDGFLEFGNKLKVVMAAGKDIMHAEQLLKRKNGEVFPAEITATIIRNEEGEVVSVTSIIRDITERKRMEEALSKFKTISDKAGYGITIVDLEGNVSYVNASFARMHGYTPDELVGKNLSIFHSEQQIAKVNRLTEQLNREGSYVAEEVGHKRKDNTEFTTLMNGTLVKDENGTPLFMAGTAIDITDRKRAEQALRDSEEKTRKMFESVTDGISVVDLNGVITEVNQRTVEMHNLGSKDELLGKNAFDIVAPRNRDKIARNMRQAIKRGTIIGVEYTLLKADGSEFPAELSTSVLKDASGKVIGHITISRDITERKKAKEKLQTILKTALDGFWLTNLEGKILEVNDSYCKIVGYTREELLKMSISDLEATESPEEVAQHIKGITEQGYGSFESQHKRKDGKIIDVEISVNYLDVGQGQLFVFARDITDRKRAEKALRESQEFSSGLLTNSPNPMLVINQDTSLRYVNPALEKLTGFSAAELTGRKAPYPWWPKEKTKEMLAGLKETMATGGRRSERIFHKKNGERFWVAHNSAPVMHEGKLIHFLVNWVDITERKQAEKREQELQRELHLSSRLAAIGELAAGIAHQINNPLTGVLGFSQRLLRKSTDQEVSQDLKRIYTEAERAAKVVQNLLTFARRRQPQKQYSDINEIMESALELRAYELKTSNIEVIADLTPKLPEVMLDFYQIQEVFLNIILNAEQAITEANGGGKLTIKTEERKGYLRATFTDDGHGIPAENLGKIFDPFFTTKGKRGGTGLGLSVCHGIATEHGGKIYAKSKPGKGTTFFVELPLPAH